MKISANKFVAVTYDLYVGEGEERELMEKATREVPLKFIYGTGSMIQAFEDALMGLESGAAFDFTITPENAYGEYNEDYVLDLPKNIFEVDGKFDSEMIQEGNTVPMMDSNGNRMNGSVLEVRDDVVVMDFNHPLAGETLHFKGEVIDVHEPTAEEIAAMTAPAGGCGCGCDSCGGGCGDHEHGDGCGCSGCH
ncbi:MAG: FKBP-type peptidyl-prolyl cis-trans isomerase [Parabacteroides sp.]|jgi:FKBP-type peptidyl-prolyl cis-trans isomerase SlyD|uniref:Peptidyl-prolyl cis-trans isomerase n=1 Tax=Parabacteroides faecalis TaxID=2924040 RepID=A0ABT0BYI5_9BACT|nr:FKBP-type peptidyl-prolyl cis-trans isomerase [Parabacteroides faecalis]MBS7343984.1 FKBP-type peptidyl-prolyl cis-trans isomerase [Parabacteroides sp.]MDY5621735.1 FKBP-type peptidyl-prolyl cis-trans isomerase [Bacteroidales bacterium]CDE61896.1 peptidyl-prolyl cis-trans isomerase [Parabacteroides sp. CAG:409]MCI7286047.1 FKBP-type peptidyl-prolyl cis-trans isomerase [Parabacteroides sp.]MCI7358835.1 FKBP-type peptidyl-prolyl cis-trans isomerase [Parabacteroides sp.]